MSKSRKIILVAAGGLAALLILVATALLVFIDVNSYKPRLEAAASDALGMDVRIGGRVGIGLFPGLRVTLEDLHIRNRGADLASAKQASLGIDLLPLLNREIRIGKIALKRPRISIERDRDGRFNFEKPEGAKWTFPGLDLTKVSLADGTLLYEDKQSGGGFEAGDCDLDASRLRLSGGEGLELLKNLAIAAQFTCREIRSKDVTVSHMKFSVDGKDRVFDLKPVTARVFGGQGSGSIRFDFSGPVPVYHVRYSLEKIRIEEFLKALSPKTVAEGSIDFSANLSLQGQSADEIRRTADGEVSLRGENLTLDGEDLDRKISQFESSQNFSLVDAGALFLAGPAGLAATKGYSFASLFLPSPLGLVGRFQGSEGRSRIRTLVSDWKVEHGVAQAEDVAMTTDENRIALKGKLDFASEQFDGVIVAVIDAKGCAKVQQKIRGPFEQPVVEKPSVLASLAGPAIKLLKQARDFFPGGQCDVFYSGSVVPPK